MFYACVSRDGIALFTYAMIDVAARHMLAIGAKLTS